jgi:hypothetical protein
MASFGDPAVDAAAERVIARGERAKLFTEEDVAAAREGDRMPPDAIPDDDFRVQASFMSMDLDQRAVMRWLDEACETYGANLLAHVVAGADPAETLQATLAGIAHQAFIFGWKLRDGG